jgi:hypothetical protein
MISEARLEEIVRAALGKGRDAAQIARATGVPLVRVQRAVHRLNGRDPAQAARATQQKKRQELQRIYGTDGRAGFARHSPQRLRLPRGRGARGQ